LEEGNNEDEEITIDLSKVKKFFKKEKKEVEEEEKEVEEKIEKEEKTIEDLEKKERSEEVQEKIDKEKEKAEELKEEKAELEDVEEEINEGEEELNEKIRDVQDIVEDRKEDIKEKKKEAKEKIIAARKETKEKIKSLKKEDDNVVFDLRKVKNIFSKKGKSKKPKEEKEEHPGKEEISFDLKKTWQFIVRHKALFLLLIPIFFSIWFRAYPIYLPITDDWARSTVYENIKGGIASQVSQQYPNLPDKQKNALIEKQFSQALQQQGREIGEQVRATSEYFKSRMQDETTRTRHSVAFMIFLLGFNLAPEQAAGQREGD